MEYYILKCYEKAKQKDIDEEQGFNRYEAKMKKIFIICTVIIILFGIETIITTLLYPTKLWNGIGIIVCVVTSFWFVSMDNKDQIKYADKYTKVHKKMLKILNKVLKSEFGINSKEKVEELISIYQEYVDKKKKEEKKRQKIVYAILSGFVGFLTISFKNMGLIGIDFVTWIYIAVMLLFLVGLVAFFVCSYTFFDSLRGKYEMMISDLKDLLLIEY